MERFTRYVDAISRAASRLAMGAMLLVVLLGATNAVLRWLGRRLGHNLSSNGALELQWYLFGVIFLLGAAHTLRRDAHVRVDVVYDRLSPRARRWIDLVGHVVLLLPFCLFLVAISLGPVADSWSRLEASPDPGGLPRYPIKTLIPLGFLLLALQGAAELVRTVRALRVGEAPPDAAPAVAPGPAPVEPAEGAP